MFVRDGQTSTKQALSVTSWLKCLLYVHRNRRLIRGREPRTATSTFTQ